MEMRTIILLSTAFVLIASGFGSGDDKSNNDRDPWNGFGIGSWAVLAESFTRGDKTESHREKQTRVESQIKASIQLRSNKEGKKPGVFDGEEGTSWHIPGFDPDLDPKCKVLDTTKQDLVIQGKKYACEVKTYDLTRSENKASVTFWRCKTANVPYREVGGDPRTLAVRPDVLRLDVDYRGKERSAKTSVRVTNFSEERKIGERKVTCVREEGTVEFSEGAMKGKGTVTRFLSNDVPGREVEMVAEGTIGDTKFQKMSRIDAFEVVKEQ